MNSGAVARLLEYGRKLRKRVPHLLVFAGVAALYLSGGLNFVEYRLTDLRFQLAQRDARQPTMHLANVSMMKAT